MQVLFLPLFLQQLHVEDFFKNYVIITEHVACYNYLTELNRFFLARTFAKFAFKETFSAGKSEAPFLSFKKRGQF